MKRQTRFIASVLLALVFFLSSRAGFADDTADEADHLFTLGAERYQANDFKAALEYFLASNRLARNRNVMFNIARCYEMLKRFPDAYKYYQRTLEEETDAAARARITDAMKKIAPSVALLKVETEPAGALIYLNRKDLGDRGRSPQTMALPPGSYTVIATLDGYEDATAWKIEVRVGSERAVKLNLARVIGTVRIEGANGADVKLDAENAETLCVAPCDAAVPPGQHTLIITKPGFRPARPIVNVRASEITVVKPQLEPVTGTLVVKSDERGASIDVDGKTEGFTPAVLQVPLGKHLVRVRLRGFRSMEREVDIKAEAQTDVDFQLDTDDAVEAASRVAERVEDAPASVSLIPGPELRAMRYPTVAEAVRGARGTFVYDDGGYTQIGFRGFARPGDYGNRVLVLVDGQPINDNWIWSSYSGYDLRTDIEDVERIEIVRGPGSVLYGTGAFAGVVNLKLGGRDLPEGREIGVSTVEHGIARGRARVVHHFSRDAGVWTSVAAGRSSGRELFFPEYATDTPPSIAGTDRNAGNLKMATLTGRAWWKAVSSQWSVHHHDKKLPAGQFETLFGDDRTRQQDTRAFLEVKADPKVSDQVQSISRAHLNYYGYRGRYARAPGDGGVEAVAYDGTWLGGEQRVVFTPVPVLRLTGGGEVQYHLNAHQRASLEGTPTAAGLVDRGQYLNDKRTFSLLAGYAMADVTPTDSFRASAAVRVDSYSTFAAASVNPRLAVVFNPWPGGNVKILGGKAFRAPSIYELYYLGTGGQRASGNLRPENLYNAELEVSHRFTRSVVGLITGYGNYITDLIALRDLPSATPETPSYAYQNTRVPVGTLGTEVELRREWKEGWMLGASYSFQRSRYLASESIGDFVTLRPATDLREVPNAPSHLASVKGAVPILERALLLMTRLTFEGPRYDRNDTEGPGQPAQSTTASAFLWDFVFSGSENRWGLSYAVGVYNAFDAKWAVPVSAEFRQRSMPQAGRTLLASAAVSF